MKKIVGISLGALAIALFANTASAQLPDVPVYAQPNGYNGLLIAGGFGMAGNDDAKNYGFGTEAGVDGTPMTYGGAIGYGMKMFNIMGMVASHDPKATGLKKPITFGGKVGVTVLQPAGSPLAVNVFGGIGLWDLKDEATSTSQFKVTNIPFGVGIGFSPPTSGSVAFNVWAAPRGNMQTWKTGDLSASRFGFGVSGGVAVNFAMGFGIHAGIDWATFSEKTGTDLGDLVKYSPMSFGAGLHYLFKLPGSEAM
jgi:opacity protein-like surface antigen